MTGFARRCWTGLSIAALLVAAVAGADDDEVRDQVGFGVESSREVENDWVTAVIGATHEDEDPARLADRINRDVSWGLELARATKGVSVRTSGYRTFPVEDPKRGQLRRWRGGQDLVLESGDAEALSALLGRLQEKLQLQRLAFGVSPERRRAVEDELIGEALDAFRARAARIATRLGAKGYALVQVQVDTSGAGPPMPMHARALGMAAEANVAPPPLEGGTSTLSAHARGTIALQR